MKKLLLSIVNMVLALMPSCLFADSFTALWKQVENARVKDLPRTELSVLQQIIDKAETEQAYGHLMKAELTKIKLKRLLSADSLLPSVRDVVERERQLRAANPVQAMVYASVLGRLYKEHHELDEEWDSLSTDYYRLSLANPELLATRKALELEPMIVEGKDSRIFYNDLLSLLAYEAGQVGLIHGYYGKVGNRQAELITGLELLRKNRKRWERDFKRSAYVASLDSMIQRYDDLTECGEVAIERYQMMEQCNVSAAERISYINYALGKWGSWQRMNVLRNAQRALTEPMFNAQLANRVLLPGRPHTMDFDKIRNLSSLTLTVSRLRLDATTQLDPANAKDYAKLKARVERVVQTQTRKLIGHADHEIFKDSITVDGLPVGVYLMEVTTDNKNIKPKRLLCYVSDLYVLSQELPGNQVRYAVVSGTTGQPVAGAKLRLTTERHYNVEERTDTVICGKDGEAVYPYTSIRPVEVLAYTNTDKYLPSTSMWNHFYFYNNRRKEKFCQLYTDRAIYRPGQTVHVAAIAFTNKEGIKTHAAKGKKIELTLYDADHEEVARQKLVTDDYGTVTADFVLPASGLNGSFYVEESYSDMSVYFQVEDYKRPTFEIEFPEVNQPYQHGDTVVVTAHARSYAGVPVQGAQVEYRVTRQTAFWWWRFGGNNEADAVLAEGTAVTDHEGAFQISMPMTLPESALVEGQKTAGFYRITASAKVTDQGGESHEGEMSLALGTKPMVFACDLPEKSLRGAMKPVTFSLRNASGLLVEEVLRYQIDGGAWHEAKTNTPLTIQDEQLASGRHLLRAVCKNDTIEQSFVIFGLDDKRPCVETHDWFFQTADEFPTDGSAVHVQVGSSDADTHILYTVIAGNKLLESGVVDQSNAILHREFTYREGYGTGLSLTFAWVKDGHTYTHQATIARPLPDKRLLLSWKTFRDRLTPGQKEEWTLTITRPDGTPANAQLMAVLYDKSLDQIVKHDWFFDPQIGQSLPSASWKWSRFDSTGFSGKAGFRRLNVENLQFNHFDPELFSLDYWLGYFDTLPGVVVSRHAQVKKTAWAGSAGASNKVMSRALDHESEDIAMPEAASADMGKAKETVGGRSENAAQVRENLNETAFFYPALTSDSDGNVALRFTLPESITTWRFLGLGHDTEMNYGILRSEAVAKKDVMIQPNMPRFVRQGDQAQLSARIINTGEREAKGTARMEIINPETGKVVYTQQVKFSVEAGETMSVAFVLQPSAFSVSSSAIGTQSSVYICRITAEGKGFSDGEQHYLPVLSDVEMVINTFPFTQHSAGLKTIDLTKLIPKEKTQSSHLTIEYTNNPAWLMIQALSSVAVRSDVNAISQTAAFYANSLGAYILKQNPSIKETLSQWQQETGSETSLMSSLQKNQELKNLVIDETPWVANAIREADQKRQLATFFDENTLEYRLDQNLKHLYALQNDDGSWSWCPDMPGSLYMTAAVAKVLVRLNAMTGKQRTTADMLDKAFSYLGNQMIEEVRQMKKLEKTLKDGSPRPSETAVDVLYTWSLDGRKLPEKVQAARTYLVDRLASQTHVLTIYGKAVAAVILGKSGHQQQAADYLESIRQYAVYKEEMGRYFDTPKAYYSWRNYKIPTEVAAIEAIKLLQPSDTQTVEEMQRWLLQSKRTQAWDTPVNSADAVYAFLNGQTEVLAPQEPAQLAVDGKPLALPKATAGLGYVKTTVAVGKPKTFTARKTSEGTSWGAVYAQFFQPVGEIEQASSGLTVKREILDGAGVSILRPQSSALKVGDKVKVRITITAERDYDFVQVSDRRAACMEPVQQLSGYHWGYYCSPKDNATNYYFNCLSKGKHVVETEYYIDRQGTYESGTCTVQCAYAPEYTARAAAVRLSVGNK